MTDGSSLWAPFLHIIFLLGGTLHTISVYQTVNNRKMAFPVE